MSKKGFPFHHLVKEDENFVWVYLKNLPLPEKPSFIEFYIVYVSSFFKFPFGIIIQALPLSKKVRNYEREMKLIFDKWNLEKIKKIIN